MKQLWIFLACCLFQTNLTLAQKSDSIPPKPLCHAIKIRPLGFADHHGNRLRGADLRETLECVNDPKIINRYKTGHGMDWVGAGMVGLGSVLVLAAGSGTSYEYSEADIKLATWGLEAIGAGAVIQFGGLALKKSAVRRYNRMTGNAPITAGKEKRIGFSLGKTFFKQGTKLEERMYVDGIIFDDNSEVANNGFCLSLFSETQLSGRLWGRSEFNWTQRGFGLSLNGADYAYLIRSITRTQFNYLEYAWLAQYEVLSGRPAIILSAGPGLGFLAGIKIKSKVTLTDAQSGKTDRETGSTRLDLEEFSFGDRIDYGLHLGAGGRWPLGDGNVCLDVRYFLGLKDLNDNPYYDKKIHNRGWSLGLGYVFGF